jgi:integrase
VRGHIEELPSGAFRISIPLGKDPVSGEYRRSSLTVQGTKLEAGRQLTKMLHDFDIGNYVEPGKLTLAEFLNRWLTDYVAIHVSKVATRESYTRKVKQHLIPALGSILLPKLTAIKLQELYRTKLESGLSSTTVNDIHRTLHRALAVGIKWGLLARNVCDATEPPKKRRLEMKTWTTDECTRFLVAAKEHRYFTLFATAIYTGLRQGELLGLRWTDCDLDRCTLTVQQTLEKCGPSPRFGTPKTAKSRRTVPLPDDLVAILRRWKATQNTEHLALGAEYKDYGLVFTIPGGAPVNRQNLSRRDFARLIAIARVPRIRFHDLRHGFASMLMAENFDLKLVSEMMGHSGIAITADTYGHLKLGPKREAANVVGRLLGQAPG